MLLLFVVEVVLSELRGLKRMMEANQIPSFSMSSAGSEKNWALITKVFKLETQVWSVELGKGICKDMPEADFKQLQPAVFNWKEELTEPKQKEEVRHAAGQAEPHRDTGGEEGASMGQRTHAARCVVSVCCIQYLSYLRQFLVLPRKVALALAPSQLLDLEEGRFGFKLSGTSDLVIIDSDVQRTMAGELGNGTLELVSAAALMATIELKKKVTERDVRQAAAELISADLHAQTLQPFAVVTDLKDDWRFLWLRGARTIMVLRVPTVEQADGDVFAPRRWASLLLRRLLAVNTELAAERATATALLEALPISIGKRQKLSPIKESPHRDDRGEEDACPPLVCDESDDDGDVDGPGWDEEDRRGVLLRQVRAAMRHTPWMKDVLRRPACFDALPMSEGARSMFG